MKNKKGIADPWDYERPPPPIEPLRISVSDDESPPLQPCRFAGHRAGVVVRLPVADADKLVPQANTNVLEALLKLLANQALFPVFRNRGIDLDDNDFEREPYVTHFSDGTRKVSVRGKYEDAIDAIALAFREAARTDSSVTKYLDSLGIRPYIK